MTDSIERQRFTKFTESFRWGYFELEPILGGVTRTCMFNDWDAPDELARFDVILKSDMEDRYWQCIEIQEKQRTTHAVKTVVRARLILPRHGRSTLEAREDWKEILLKAFDHQMNWAKNDGFRVRWDVDYVLKAMAKLGPAGEDPVLEKPAWTELLGDSIAGCAGDLYGAYCELEGTFLAGYCGGTEEYDRKYDW
ncbi:hypothetical protein M7I_5325 [Glarea lozoyensis 74030]|uniref:Uncharacterized protein n=1 Tax=Glarea lozoyensis (strain ATCC 74030 / MF5533) TaxID=1104152 RepID=H0ERK6_GLAL7|nr:hypothetical protein M7I_5325 [Glarea lozoyensis 74030]